HECGHEPPPVRTHVRYVERVDTPSVSYLDPFVCGSVALLAIHSWRNKDSIALVTLSSNYPSLLQLVQESAYCDARGPAVSGHELILDIEVLSLLQLIRRDLVAWIACYFLGHFLSTL